MGCAKSSIHPCYVLSLFSHFSRDARGTAVERWANSTFNPEGVRAPNRRFAQNEGKLHAEQRS
jgi:hypothetical protein